MGILSSRALKGRIPTAGQVLSNGFVLDLFRNPKTGQVFVLFWSGTETTVAPIINFDKKDYVPPNIEPTVLAALQLPSVYPSAAPPARELFDDVCRHLAKYTALSNGSLRQVAYFIFATWLADRVTIAPFLWVATPSAADGSEFLQFLALFCRRSLLLSADSTTGLWTLPMYLRPTLLLDGAELTAPMQNFLYASNSKGIHCVKRGQALDLFCAKAICSQDSLRDPALAGFAVQISLPPKRTQLPVLTQELRQDIVNTFQSKFLGYRLAHFQKVGTPEIDVQGLKPATQGVARSLAACILDDEKLQSEAVSLLRDQDREISDGRSAGLESVVLEALLHCCHEENRSTVRVAELAEATNTLLSQKGHNLQLSPESVGWKLRYLRFPTEAIGSGGKGLWLLDDVRRKIHSQAGDYSVPLDPQGALQGCPYCSNFMGEGPFAGGEGAKRSEDLSEA